MAVRETVAVCENYTSHFMYDLTKCFLFPLITGLKANVKP